MRKNLITLKAAGEFTSMSRWTLRRLISQGELTGYRVGHHALRIDENELNAYLERNTIPTIATMETSVPRPRRGRAA